MNGIDISRWNTVKDWNKLADTNEFIIIKCGGGDDGIYTDRNFETNFRESCKHFDRRGVYWYLGGNTSANITNEINYYLTILKNMEIKYKTFSTLPVFIDAETKEQYNNPNIKELLTSALKQIEKAGYYAGLYTYRNFYDTKLQNLNKRFYTWIADYRNTAKNSYSNQNDFKILQYGQKLINGAVDGETDADIMYKDISEKIIKNGFNHLTK